MPTYTYMQADRPKTAFAADVPAQPLRKRMTLPRVSVRTGRYIEYALMTMTGLAGLFFAYEVFVYFSQTH